MPHAASLRAHRRWDADTLVAPDWLNNGDNAWQLTAATLVGLQSVPGLMVMYAGLVKKKWAINSAFMVLYAFAAVLITWVVYAYKAAFGKQMLPFVGVPGPAVAMNYELVQAYLPEAELSGAYPMSTMVYFQFVFAAITVVLIAGAALARMNFLAWMAFVPLWLTLSYTVGAFSIWGGGFLFVSFPDRRKTVPFLIYSLLLLSQQRYMLTEIRRTWVCWIILEDTLSMSRLGQQDGCWHIGSAHDILAIAPSFTPTTSC